MLRQVTVEFYKIISFAPVPGVAAGLTSPVDLFFTRRTITVNKPAEFVWQIPLSADSAIVINIKRASTMFVLANIVLALFFYGPRSGRKGK
jgi:hypothetical protein